MKKLAINRKLGKTTDIRMAMLKTLTTDLILKGKVETTEARAKEVKAIADSIIALAIKEKDNFEMVDVKVVKAKLDAKGNKVTPMAKIINIINKIVDIKDIPIPISDLFIPYFLVM